MHTTVKTLAKQSNIVGKTSGICLLQAMFNHAKKLLDKQNLLSHAGENMFKNIYKQKMS